VRRSHYIRRNDRSETPSNAVWFDTETDPVPLGRENIGHTLRFGYAAYSRTRGAGEWIKPQWLRFTTRAEFWDWVVDRAAAKKTLYLFCHNTSFDLPVLDIFHELPRRGWKLTRACIDAPPTMLTFRRGAARIDVLDTLNFWKVPLKALGEMVGLPKLEMPTADAPAGEWETYAHRDVEILLKACMDWWRWLRDEDMGSFAPTLAAQAMRTWRHRYMDTRVLVHDTEPLLAMERESYHGGRTECFRLGRYDRRFHVLDVNSLYPSVMRDFDYPTKIAFRRKVARGFDWRTYASLYATLARVVIDTDEPAYPALRDGKLIFPTGRFDATLCGPELIYAADHGHLAEITEVAYYERGPIFRSFVDDIYARRLAAKAAGDETTSHFYKIMMNSLYGKFGQRGQVWEDESESDDLSARCWKEVDAQTGVCVQYRQLGGLVQHLEREPESRESCPIIASYVTSYARMKLWALIQLAGRANVYYCDTDSLLVTDAGMRRLKPAIDPHRLGALKYEGWVPHVEIMGAKDYVWGCLRRVKGVRSRAEWLDASTVKQERWRGLRGQVADGILDMPTTATITKRLSRVYTKGTTSTGGKVTPHHLAGG